MSDEAPVKRWTAERESAVVIDIFKGKIMPVEVAREHDLTVAEVERWVGEAERSMENGFRMRPKDVREQYAEELQKTREALGDAHLQIYALKKYRRLAIVLGENKKPIQRILQINGWQLRKRPQGFRPRAKALPSVTHRPDERWATDISHVWCGRDRRGALAAVIDCCTREILGWRLSSSGATATAEAALEEALISRLRHLQRVERPLMLRSDNGLVFSSKHYTNTVRAYGLTQEFIAPYTPEQNAPMERFFCSLREECIRQHRFESLAHARHVVGQWIRFYNNERPHQSLGYAPPSAHPALAS